ncbi:MAG: hypothetical protein N3A61_08885, partial [Ignavibacteria bacterium]|nr:hypothetical protein [Ignavibacteria bacterium]
MFRKILKLFRINYKFYWFAFFSVVVFSVALLRLPLSNILGFEFSIIISLPLTLFSGLITIYFKRKGYALKSMIIAVGVIVLIPLLLSLLNSFIVRNCSIGEGIFYYLIFPTISSVFGFSVGLIICGLTKKYQYLIFVILYIIIFSWSLVVYYLNPQLFLFNPIYGFFPGFVYDEDLSISSSIIFNRLFILIISMIGIFIVESFTIVNRKKIQSKIWSLLFVLIYCLGMLALILYSDELNFITSQEKLIKNFPKKLVTEKYGIYVQNDSSSNFDLKLIDIKTKIIYDELKDFFKSTPSKKFSVFIFKDDNQKRQLLGTAAADFAKPWLYQIYITEDNIDGVLKHEMAHIFCAEFSDNIFKVAADLNTGLIEGAAVAAEWNYLNKTPHQLTADVFHFIAEQEPAYFMKGFNFAFKHPIISYVISGSFIRFLIDKYGIERFKELYRTNNFNQAYSTSLDVLASEYKKFIKETFSASSDSLMIEYYFKRESIMEKECLRFIGRKTKEAFGFINDEKFELAQKEFYKLWVMLPNHTTAYGLVLSLFRQKKYSEVINFYKTNIPQLKDFNPKYLQVYLITALSFSFSGDYTASSAILDKLLQLNLSQEFNLGIEARKKLLNYDSKKFEEYIFSKYKKETIQKLLNDVGFDEILYQNYYEFLTDSQKEKLFDNLRNFSTFIVKKMFYYYLERGEFQKIQKLLESTKKSELNVTEFY